VKLSAHRLTVLALVGLAWVGLALIGVGRWWWQPRAGTDEGPHTLRWDLSGACTQVYAFTVDESFAHESVGLFLGRPEEHSRWLLAVGPHPQLEGRLAALLVPEQSTSDESDQPRLRELFTSPESRELGPAAPDFACRSRSWDPLEDALALGWPELPAAPVRPGDHWRGQVVGGRCHETPCLDARGEFDPGRSCQARPWDEGLVGWHEATGAGPAIAVLRSTWDDGHEDETSNYDQLGILTQRELTIAEGRPLLARVEIWHRWTGVVRQLELRALDECAPGGDLAETIARVRASLPASG
jgi:hypothetical protein